MPIMNTKEYLKSIGQDPNAAPAREDDILDDPRVKAALEAQSAKFQDDLKGVQEYVDKRKAEDDKANDPARFTEINGQRIELPEDEETWDQWIDSARGKVHEIRGNPEAEEAVIRQTEAAFDKLRGEHYKFLARQSVKSEETEEKTPDAPSGLSHEQDSALDELGLEPGTKGHRAVVTLVQAGTPFADALDMIGVEVENIEDFRTAPQDREGAAHRAGRVPQAGQNGMQPPPSVRVRNRGGNTSNNMNAALAAKMQARRDPSKIFRKKSN
jgi:hypothetical protein